MNPLKEAIQLMTKEETRAFKLFIQKVNTQEQRKDIELFDAIRKSRNEYAENEVFARIYPGASKNTFHRLKSRLLQDINRSLVDLHLENSDTLKLWHFMSVLEFYLSRRHFELAHWFLRKAENLAEKLDNFEALDAIYGSYIRLSFEVMTVNPEIYITKRKENQQQLQQIRMLDDVLAAAVYRIKIAQTWGERGGELIQTLERTVEDFATSNAGHLSAAVRIKLFQSVSNILLDKRDYATLANYVKECLDQFEADSLFNRNTHETKLLMLTYHANALNKIGKYQESLKAAELLGRAMKDYDSVLQDKYMFFFYNALLINYFKVDLDKSLKLLEEMLANERLIGSPFNLMFVHMNFALVWREKGDYRKAIKNIVLAINCEAYKAAAAGLRLRIAVSELMIRLNHKDYEVLELRVRQVRNEFKEEMKQFPFRREEALLGIIELITEHGNAKLPQIKTKIQQFLKIPVESDDKDAELIAYDEFVRDL
jgi:tetratricopeptide (TPR) repeat protein